MLLVLLSLIPSVTLRMLLFETLAYPIPSLPRWVRYEDKPFLTPGGAFLVAMIWAVVLFVLFQIGARLVRKR